MREKCGGNGSVFVNELSARKIVFILLKRNKKVLNTNALKKINFSSLTLAFVQSPIKTFSLYLQINRLFAGVLREG